MLNYRDHQRNFYREYDLDAENEDHDNDYNDNYDNNAPAPFEIRPDPYNMEFIDLCIDFLLNCNVR